MATDLHGYLNKFSEQRIVVIGDVMLDTFIFGDVERVSPEAPVPVIKQTDVVNRAGGAANVAANLANLGVSVDLFGVVGNDESAQELRRLMENVRCKFLTVNNPTIQKTRLIADRQQLLRYDKEERFKLTESQEQEMLSFFDDVPEGSVVIVSDYAKGSLTSKVYDALKQKYKLIVDPKPSGRLSYSGAFLITPNKKEAKEMAEGDDINEWGENLRQRLGSHIIITRGGEGVSLFEQGVPARHIPTTVNEVHDVTGAGDTFIAVLSAAIACGANLFDASLLANEAAGFVVGKIGTAAVTRQDIAARLTRSKSKIKTREEISKIVADLKAQGKVVVHTNGCFDILHLGHIRLLRKAKSCGDILVLGINSDDSVKRYKGPTRPIVPEQERAEMLASLDCVDYVVIFPEDTPCELISAMKPSVHFKGGDYDPDNYEQMPESKVVRDYGGRVEIFPLVEGKSTTNIVEKIRRE